MTLNKNHPTRSHAFLSRLHDGDLEPSERAHFEAHRAHCKECRDAAADFERALSLFRSSRSSPPPADLASRVLRKVRTHAGSRRTPFGDLFSVDLRWAGAFAAALLVLLVAAPIVLRQQKKTASAEGPIPVDLESRAVPPSDKTARASADPGVPDTPGAREEQGRVRAPQTAQAAPKRAEAQPAAGYASAPQEDAKREEKLSTGEMAAAVALRNPVSNLNRQVAAAPPAPAPEPQGEEGARDQVLVSGDAPTLDRPARLVVQPLDALGSPPALETRSQSPSLNDLRGRSYVVLVDGQGHVIEAQEAASKNSAGTEPKRRDAALAKEKDNSASASAALKSLRFKPGERQRRLLVRVE
ncbi:MAG TPA: hypothetical protein VGS00_01845 [Thermoanaerobaculia bacterium]|nr:hypothetical protein [Thermoanaerobaculia bacterium]